MTLCVVKTGIRVSDGERERAPRTEREKWGGKLLYCYHTQRDIGLVMDVIVEHFAHDQLNWAIHSPLTFKKALFVLIVVAVTRSMFMPLRESFCVDISVVAGLVTIVLPLCQHIMLVVALLLKWITLHFVRSE